MSAFPGFENVRLSASELETIVSLGVDSWRAALSSVGGVYLVTDLATGRLYVGSACGEAGIWQRWCEYAATGHAGNAEPRELLSREGRDHAASFQYPVLEIADTRADRASILAR